MQSAAERRQPMTTTGLVAARFTDAKRSIRREIPAGPGAGGVDGAAYGYAHLTFERTTAGIRGIGATHAPDALGDGNGKRFRHTTGGVAGQFGYMEIDAQGRAASTAGAAVVDHVTRSRRSTS